MLKGIGAEGHGITVKAHLSTSFPLFFVLLSSTRIKYSKTRSKFHVLINGTLVFDLSVLDLMRTAFLWRVI